ncbi:hypothetical protein JCM24511_05920 [Saitozyma sp. JCM 24511]|nr:hypothetical protein JCM24511_05920 [Saitozyma sp. JCM 24511]
MFASALVAAAALMAGQARAQVTATGTMGPTNPSSASLNTAVNQTSMARLISLNGINDFCLFAPPEPNSVIGNTEQEEVAWCIQPRNNARVIPDGTFQAVHFVKTPLYWQVMGWGDFTKINIADGDFGGELDPHGATGDGNPVGGNVTANATGQDVHYQEWMNYMAYNQFCLRICISENSTYSAANECQHTLDEMGCQWVMPGDYTNNSFTECDADSAYPPGWYPQAGGSISTFAQRYTGTYTAGGTVGTYTIGQTVTPQTAYSTPASSNCITYSTVSNGIASLASNAASASGASGASTTGGSSASGSAKSGSASGSAAKSGSASGSGAAASGSTSKSGAMSAYTGANYGPAFAGVFSVVALVAGAGAVFL